MGWLIALTSKIKVILLCRCSNGNKIVWILLWIIKKTTIKKKTHLYITLWHWCAARFVSTLVKWNRCHIEYVIGGVALCTQNLEVKWLELWAEESGSFGSESMLIWFVAPHMVKTIKNPSSNTFPKCMPRYSSEAAEFCANSFIMKLSDQSVATQRGPDGVELMAPASLQLWGLALLELCLVS